MMSLPSASGALFSSFIVSLHTMQLKRPISGLLSSFNDILGARTGSLPLRLLPSLPGDKTCSIFRIGRVSLGLFLAGKCLTGRPFRLTVHQPLGGPCGPDSVGTTS